MYKFKDSSQFLKSGDIVFNKYDISHIDCSDIENLIVKVTLRDGTNFIAQDIHAIELMMQIKPSALEGKRLRWPKFVWLIHNILGHPLTQILALLKLYKLAFWIHDVTVPKPIGKKEKKETI